MFRELKYSFPQRFSLPLRHMGKWSHQLHAPKESQSFGFPDVSRFPYPVSEGFYKGLTDTENENLSYNSNRFSKLGK